MRLVKRFVGTLLLLALILGGTYGYAWYQIKNYIDQQIAGLSGQLAVSYQNMVYDPRGTVSLEAIKVVPEGYTSALNIARLSLRTDDPFFYLSPQSRIENGDWPGFLSLAFDKLETDLGADFLRVFETDAAAQLLHQQPVALEALGCAEVRSFTPAVLREMGVNQINTDLVLNLQADNDRGTSTLFVDLDTPGMFALNLDLSFSFGAGYLKPATLSAANPRLKSFQMEYEDLGYYKKRDRYCSDALGTSVDLYRQAHLDLAKQRAAQLRMDVPEVIWQGYMDATSAQAKVDFSLNPVGGLGAEAMLQLGEPVALIDRLRLRWSVNGRPVDLAEVNWIALIPDPEAVITDNPEELGESVSSDSAEVVARSEDAAVSQASAPTDIQSLLAPKPEPPQKRFRRTAFEELPRYISSDIRIITYYGNRVEGRLEAVEGDSLKILHRVDRGMAIYPVDRDKLEFIEVLR